MSQLSGLIRKAKRVLSPASVRKYAPRSKRAGVVPVPTPAGLRDDVQPTLAQTCGEAVSVEPVEMPVAAKKQGARKKAAKRAEPVDSLDPQENAALQALDAQSSLTAPDQSRTAPWGDVDWEDDDEDADEEPVFPAAAGGASPRLAGGPHLGMCERWWLGCEWCARIYLEVCCSVRALYLPGAIAVFAGACVAADGAPAGAVTLVCPGWVVGPTGGALCFFWQG